MKRQVISVATPIESQVTNEDLTQQEIDDQAAEAAAFEAAQAAIVDAPSNIDILKGITALIATVDAIPTVDLHADTTALKQAIDDYITYIEG